MERRFEARKQNLLDEAEVKPEVVNGVLTRLKQRRNERQREPARFHHYKRHNLLAPLRAEALK